MDDTESLRQALTITADQCRSGHYKHLSPIKIGDGMFTINEASFRLRDVLRSVAAEADQLGLDPAPLLMLLQPQPISDLAAAIGDAIIFVERVALRQRQQRLAEPAAGPMVRIPGNSPAFIPMGVALHCYPTKPVLRQAKIVADLFEQAPISENDLFQAVSALKHMIWLGTPEEWRQTVGREIPANLTQLRELMVESGCSIEFIEGNNFTPFDIGRMLLVKLRGIKPPPTPKGKFARMIEAEAIYGDPFAQQPTPRGAELVDAGMSEDGGADLDSFDVFLCFNSADRQVVELLRESLTKGGLSVWFDEDRLALGERLPGGIEKGLRGSSSVAVCVGPTGIGPWQTEEIYAALHLAMQEQRPVIPVLLPGAPDKPGLPLFLESRRRVEFRKGFTDEGLQELIRDIKRATDKKSTA